MMIVFNILLFHKGSIVVVAIVEKVADVISLVVEILFWYAHQTQRSGLTQINHRPHSIHPVWEVTLWLILSFEGWSIWD